MTISHWFRRGTLLLALLLGLPAFAAQKFDASLQLLMHSTEAARQSGMAGLSEKTGSQPRIRVLAKATPEGMQAMRKLGATVGGALGDIASVELSVSMLPELIALPGVSYVGAERRLPQRLNFSVPATRANLLRGGTAPAFTGVAGANVIVGVIDDGLDFRHLDFRKPDGTTRLLGLWDQRADGAAGTPPPGFDYGGVCTITMLNNAINNSPATACTQPSTGNHGTHVGGIAAGNGQQTGNAQAAYRFIGMAPQADILAANSIGGGIAAGNAVVDAITWMKAVAAGAGKPLVVNLSLGSYFGARDGTSNFEQALSNAGQAGVIVVAAAGNEGADAIRATGTISQGQTQTVTFNWPNNVAGGQRIELWYPGANQYAIKINGPNGCTTGFHAAGTTQTYTLPCGTISITSTAAQASNDDRQIQVNFTPANPVTATQGAWSVELRGDVVAAPNTPFSMICGETGQGILFTSNTAAVTTEILTDTASATRTIAVGSYNTNYSWTSLGGNPFNAGGAGPIGDVSNFSSRGPRRNCSNLAKCPAVAKPEITAPGALVMAALGQDAPVPMDGTTEADGKHVAYNGTSMATPHVAGAIALMLSKNGTLTPEQVKGILFGSVQTNGFTTGLPNIAWGNGILDAQAAYNATPGNAPVAGIDLNADSKPDLIWRNLATGDNYAWFLNGTLLAGSVFMGNVGPAWNIAAVADFNADGKPDLVWRNQGTGDVYLWYMNGITVTGSVFLFNVPDPWKIAGSADFNADGKPDVVWRNATTGDVYVWYMNGASLAGSAFLTNVPAPWDIAASVDLNADARPDLIWRNQTTGDVYAWYLNGLTVTSSTLMFNIAAPWEIKGAADMNGDGRPDILWRNQTTGDVYAWFLNGIAFTGSTFMFNVPAPWTPRM